MSVPPLFEETGQLMCLERPLVISHVCFFEGLYGLPQALGGQLILLQALVALPFPLPQLEDVLFGVAELGCPGNVQQALFVLAQPAMSGMVTNAFLLFFLIALIFLRG